MSAHTFLKTRRRAIRYGFDQDFGLRIHRAISWVGGAETETEHSDASFLFFWIAFNTAYAAESEGFDTSEHEMFREFFQKLSEFDDEHQIYNAVWTRFSGPIRMFLENQYVFSPFWKHQNGTPGFENWQERFTAAKVRLGGALENNDTITILSMLFDRLYVLRNQIIHGGATWNSSVIRDQLRDGAAIIAFLVPVFIDLMMDNAQEDWGQPFYPVVEE